MQKFQAALLRALPLTQDVVQYDFSWTDIAVEFKSGQFFMLQVEDAQGKVSRAYSVASSPSNKDFFSLCVKLLPDGRGSALLRGLKPGESASFMAPFGHFFVNDAGFTSAKDIVMVATGTGLAPFMSMLPDLFEKGFSGKIDLYFGVRHEADLFYVDELRAWEAAHSHFKAHVSLSQPSETWTGLKGRVTEFLNELAYDKVQVYICGNGDMVKGVKTSMQEKGVPKEDLHWEQFTAL
ncbi:FAD-dependent oxidoreductase [Candidatus Peregrinibacteria bacterium]|nr:MAG: FAD-dependent oxidoreductase [Candidatus Peregrinibacteria bacterium]